MKEDEMKLEIDLLIFMACFILPEVLTLARFSKASGRPPFEKDEAEVDEADNPKGDNLALLALTQSRLLRVRINELARMKPFILSLENNFPDALLKTFLIFKLLLLDEDCL